MRAMRRVFYRRVRRWRLAAAWKSRPARNTPLVTHHIHLQQSESTSVTSVLGYAFLDFGTNDLTAIGDGKRAEHCHVSDSADVEIDEPTSPFHPLTASR